MNKKDASSKQEKMIADYMGWKVVSGSGSRPFRPGDVGSDHFLVECKTHVSPQANVIFQQSHWNKIAIEARSVNKYPMLVTDNGTQKANSTWVAISKGTVTSDHSNRMLNSYNTSRSGNTIIFKHEEALSLYRSNYIDCGINFFEERFDNERLAIMPLEEFKKFYEEQFEC